jgi:hypothetical protein
LATPICFLQTENGNGKLPFLCCKRKRITGVRFPWLANDKQKLTITASANMPIYAGDFLSASQKRLFRHSQKCSNNSGDPWAHFPSMSPDFHCQYKKQEDRLCLLPCMSPHPPPPRGAADLLNINKNGTFHRKC